MNRIAPHIFWLGLLVCAVLLMAISTPILQYASEKANADLIKVRAESSKTSATLYQLQDDIAAVQKLSSEISSAEADQWLAPVDRLRVASLMEQQANETRLSHFTYTVAPEQRTSIETPGAGPQQLALSSITLSADAALDTDIYHFIDGLHAALPGRVRLQQMVIEKNGNGTPGSPNLKLTATLEWLSNGAIKDLAGAP
ncbi:MAG TPA: hypothetical protein VFR09_04630 [Alphaproteobacteria bacterium]|nr:hypothetical protein [Alphaproteobacteria bacterium]